MSRPKFYWYSYIQNVMRRYPYKLEKDNTIQSTIALVGIKKAIEETAVMHKHDGAERIRLIEMVYFKQTHSIDSAADALYISPRTAQNWIHDFIYLAAKRIGMQ